MGLDQQLVIIGKPVHHGALTATRQLNTSRNQRRLNKRQVKKHFKNIEAKKGCFFFAERNHTELFYWRKFNPLQGWFEANFNIQNCETVSLSLAILDKLEYDMNAEHLKSTSGFFYGGEWDQSEIKEALVPGLEAARNAIDSGSHVGYYCNY